MNIENFNKVIKQIIDHPETYNQRIYHSECGTSHCIAGWCDVLSGSYDIEEWEINEDYNSLTVIDRAVEFLEITYQQGIYLFAHQRTLKEVLNFPQWAEDNPE